MTASKLSDQAGYRAAAIAVFRNSGPLRPYLSGLYIQAYCN
jgi:hypothetical protein